MIGPVETSKRWLDFNQVARQGDFQGNTTHGQGLERKSILRHPRANSGCGVRPLGVCF